MKIKLNISGRGDGGGVLLELYKQILASFASNILAVCSGYAYGVSAVLLPQLKEEPGLEYDASYDSWIASMSPLAMIFGAISIGTILDALGRKTCHIILSFPLVIGWGLIGFGNSTSLILVGRFLTGWSAGATRPVTLVYSGEIWDPKYRNIALFFPGILITFGTLCSHVLGYYLNREYTSVVCLVLGLIALIVFPFLKESPVWLISKGRIEEGMEAFRWFRGTQEVSEDELKTIVEKQSEKTSTKELMGIILSKSFLKPLFICILLMINTQLCGINILNFYAQDVFNITFSGQLNPFLMMVVTDSIRSFGNIGICFIAKLLPRKLTYIACSFGVALSLFGLVACMLSDMVQFLWVSVVCLVVYLCLSTSLLSIGWTFVPEVLPTKARGFGSGVVSTVTYILLFIVIKVSPEFMEMYGTAAMYGSCGVIVLICLVILSFTLPETNGKTLQSIEDSYSKNQNAEGPLRK